MRIAFVLTVLAWLFCSFGCATAPDECKCSRACECGSKCDCKQGKNCNDGCKCK